MPGLPGVARADALAHLADALAALPDAARVAIDGVDAAGKTTIADELAVVLRDRGEQFERVCADDFLRPAAERHRRGRESAEGYYLDSFDHDALRRSVLATRGRVLVDGIFLMRPELNDLWDFRVFVDVSIEESIRRGAGRDAEHLGSAEAAERLYRRRYAPAQRRYLAELRPQRLADVVVDNSVPESPRVAFRAGVQPPTA